MGRSLAMEPISVLTTQQNTCTAPHYLRSNSTQAKVRTPRRLIPSRTSEPTDMKRPLGYSSTRLRRSMRLKKIGHIMLRTSANQQRDSDFDQTLSATRFRFAN